ncbi:hypothetical protein ABES03_08635 [Neobacillus rhizosphaerae]|uniref:hypothetical protein n=1 Tax=Neobacillus rhizosphaerae TaxID=2880965 RepID=UPI003D2DA1DA
MKKFRVKTPVETFNGTRYGVRFENGEAVAELNEQTVSEFESWGYLVEEIVEKQEAPKPKKTQKKNEK